MRGDHAKSTDRNTWVLGGFLFFFFFLRFSRCYINESAVPLSPDSQYLCLWCCALSPPPLRKSLEPSNRERKESGQEDLGCGVVEELPYNIPQEYGWAAKGWKDHFRSWVPFIFNYFVMFSLAYIARNNNGIHCDIFIYVHNVYLAKLECCKSPNLLPWP